MSKNATLFNLDEGTKKLLSAMNFEPIPDEAKYLAFFEDGNAMFFEDFDLGTPFALASEMVFITYHTGVTLEL